MPACILARDPDWILNHSGYVRSDECPVIGCTSPREVRAQLDWPNQRRVVTACERHLAYLVARSITRVVKQNGGQEAVEAYVDGTTVRRCIP